MTKQTDKIKKLLTKGEGEALEFKASFNQECLTTLNAFANSIGGTVLVGVSAKGVPIGT